MVRGFSHGCHGEPQLGCGHFVPVATFSTACPHEDKSNLGAFGDEFTFELSQAAKMPKTSLPAGLVVSIEAPCPDNRLSGSYPQKMRSLAMSERSVVSRHRRPMFAMRSRVLRQHQCYRLLEVSHGVFR